MVAVVVSVVSYSSSTARNSKGVALTVVGEETCFGGSCLPSVLVRGLVRW